MFDKIAHQPGYGTRSVSTHLSTLHPEAQKAGDYYMTRESGLGNKQIWVHCDAKGFIKSAGVNVRINGEWMLCPRLIEGETKKEWVYPEKKKKNNKFK